MISHRLRTICCAGLGAATVLWFASCMSPGPSVEERKARVPEFHFATASVAADAYHTPDAKWGSDWSSTLPKYTGGGLLPVLIGVAIDQQVRSNQQATFDRQVALELPAVNRNAGGLPIVAVDDAVRAAVEKNPFLRGKVRESSGAVLQATVIHFGLGRKNQVQEPDPIVAAEIWVSLDLKRGPATVVHLGTFSGMSRSPIPISQVAADPAAAGALYREAAASFEDLLNIMFGTRYGE